MMTIKKIKVTVGEKADVPSSRTARCFAASATEEKGQNKYGENP